MDADAVRIAHARIAQAMERYDLADPERMVEHYSGAGDGMRAGETAVQAGHAAAQKLAFNRAAELYRRAIELLPDHGGSRSAICTGIWAMRWRMRAEARRRRRHI